MVDGICVHPVIVDVIWPKVSHYIKRAMERGDLGRFDLVEAEVLKGGAILWIAVNDGAIIGAAVTQIHETEKSKVCEVLALGSDDFAEMVKCQPLVEQYAGMFGCRKMRFAGRKGWARRMKGYTASKVVMERQL